MYRCEYSRPADLESAVQHLEAKEEVLILAGGMTLLPAMKMRLAAPAGLVDLRGIESLRGIRASGDTVEIGAMALHDEVARSQEVREAIPALAALAGEIGDAQVRNRGTLGGSIANNDPAADYPAAVLGLGATIVTTSREIAADDFFTGMFETALGSGEIVTSVRFPKVIRAGYGKFPNPASRYAVAGVFVANTGQGVRVAVTGAAGCVFRSAAFEKALEDDFSPAAIADISVTADDYNEDLHASAEYRAHLVGVMARRAVQTALNG